MQLISLNFSTNHSVIDGRGTLKFVAPFLIFILKTLQNKSSRLEGFPQSADLTFSLNSQFKMMILSGEDPD